MWKRFPFPHERIVSIQRKFRDNFFYYLFGAICGMYRWNAEASERWRKRAAKNSDLIIISYSFVFGSDLITSMANIERIAHVNDRRVKSLFWTMSNFHWTFSLFHFSKKCLKNKNCVATLDESWSFGHRVIKLIVPKVQTRCQLYLNCESLFSTSMGRLFRVNPKPCSSSRLHCNFITFLFVLLYLFLPSKSWLWILSSLETILRRQLLKALFISTLISQFNW